MSDSVEIKQKPWMCQEAINVLDCVLAGFFQANIDVLEFGSGGSTIWFAKRHCRVTSIENNPEWAEKVQGNIARIGLYNVNMHISNWDDEIYDIAFQAETANLLPDSSFDLIFVDNNSKGYAPTKLREVCTRVALPKLKDNGWFVLDNINYDYVIPALELFEGWPKIEVHNGIWHTGFYHKAPVEEAWYT